MSIQSIADQQDKTIKVTLGFVTVCKGRLEHLKQTLPLILEQSPDEVIVVDYNCPQGTGDWVEANYKSVKVIRVTDDQGLNISRARNIGAHNSTSTWLCFIDADILVANGFVSWIRQNAKPRFYYIADRTDIVKGCFGTVICSHDSFDRIEGYDEVFIGWGAEDSDLFDRLNLAGIVTESFPNSLISSIQHDDEMRVTFYSDTDKNISHMRNRIYQNVKQLAMTFKSVKHELPLDLRRDVYSQIYDAFDKAKNAWPDQLPQVEIQIKAKDWLPSGFRVSKKIVISMEVTHNSKVAQAKHNIRSFLKNLLSRK